MTQWRSSSPDLQGAPLLVFNSSTLPPHRSESANQRRALTNTSRQVSESPRGASDQQVMSQKYSIFSYFCCFLLIFDTIHKQVRLLAFMWCDVLFNGGCLVFVTRLYSASIVLLKHHATKPQWKYCAFIINMVFDWV